MVDDTCPSLHGTSVAFGNDGLLLLGDSGSGKSLLALALITHYGARLVGDDRTMVCRDGDSLWLSPLPGWEGAMEVRGVGIVRLPFVSGVRLRLVLHLGNDEKRLPEIQQWQQDGVTIPCLSLQSGHPALPLKACYAWQRETGHIQPWVMPPTSFL